MRPRASRPESRGGLAVALVVIAVLACAGCRRSRSGGNPSASGAALPPLAGIWLASLTVPGFPASKVALPLGARRPRPLIVALHGDDDRPEWPCGSYHHVARSAFVLCPTGVPRSDERFTLGSLDATRAELRASLPRLKSSYANHLAKGAVVLSGLGPSVEHAISLALEEPAFFSRLVLIDGPFTRWSSGAAERFAKAGGVRVLFVCTTRPQCQAEAADHGLQLRRSGADTRWVASSRARGLDGEATELIAREWKWLVAGDNRWN